MVLLFTIGNLGVLYRTIDVGGVPFDWFLSDLTGIALDGHLFGLDANTIFAGTAAGIIGLSLSEGAYMAEIVRAGLSSVDRGQEEAAAALGMTRGLALRRIVLPQALRVIVPPTGNEAIAMLKDTSLVFVIPVSTELFFQLNAVGTRTFQPVPMYVAACLWYLAMSSVLMVGQYFLERRFGRGFERTGQRARPRIMGGMGGA
jgi:polar amino acid transport system permease protein